MAIIAIPKSLMLLYGLLSDNFVMCGSKRKAHILLNVSVCIVMVAIIISVNYTLGKYWMTALFFI